MDTENHFRQLSVHLRIDDVSLSRWHVVDGESFARTLYSQRTIDVEINADAIYVNCERSIWLHSAEPMGCHVHLMREKKIEK